MTDTFRANIPSLKQVWNYLVKDELHTSTLSVCIFSAAVPVAIFIGILLSDIFRRKAGISVSEVISNTFWPTFISAAITVFFWVALLSWAFVRIILKDKDALHAVIAQKATYISQISEAIGRRDQEHADRVNADARKIVDLQEHS